MPLFKDDEIVQRIRFLHHKINHLEDALEKEDETFSLDDLNLVLEYTRILNIDYRNESHKRLLKELSITPVFYDPILNRDIEIYDINFECTRTLAILARAYARLSEGFEDEEDWENAVIAMVESSKIYKTAAYFSAASIHQKDKGETLAPETLELNSEETRGWAQSVAAAREEHNNNLYFASKLYSGLSLLSRRIFYLKTHEEKKKQQLRAQFHYDMGKACLLKARASEESSLVDINSEKVKSLNQKANFYFLKSKEIWEDMLKNLKGLSKDEKENIEINLSVVNDNFKNNQIKVLEYEQIKRIQDPEPVVIVPENLAPFVPKASIYLTKYVPKDLNVKRFKTFKAKTLEKKIPYSKREKLLDKKAGVLRTINELKILKENKEIEVDKFAELMEKYATKLTMIDTAIGKLSKK